MQFLFQSLNVNENQKLITLSSTKRKTTKLSTCFLPFVIIIKLKWNFTYHFLLKAASESTTTGERTTCRRTRSSTRTTSSSTPLQREVNLLSISARFQRRLSIAFCWSFTAEVSVTTTLPQVNAIHRDGGDGEDADTGGGNYGLLFDG